MYQTILVPVDGSDLSESILPQVKLMANVYRATVILLKVLDPPLLLGYDEIIDYPKYQKQRRRIEQESKAYLYQLRDRLRADGIAAKILVENGTVVETIFEVAYRENADLVALSSHGWCGWKKSYYGSTAAGLLERTGLPLLIFRFHGEESRA